MATWPTGLDYTPSFTSSQDTSYNIIEANFRNASQRAADGGANAITRKWNLKWDKRTATATSTIKAFLDARQGYEWFYWTVPSNWGTESVKVVCKEAVKYTPEDGLYTTITAVFEEVFDQV